MTRVYTSLLLLVATLALALVAGTASAKEETPPAKEKSVKDSEPAAVAAPMADIRLLAANCFTCHGPDGRSVGLTKDLTGLTLNEMVKTMREYRSGRKKSSIMGRITKGYTVVEIEALAKYFSTRNDDTANKKRD